MPLMPEVSERIGERGATFPDNFTNWALCCPSRATYLTGQYARNHMVRGNSQPNGGYATFSALHGTNNLAVWMRDGGYFTGYIGKYMNGYALGSAPNEVPQGWNEWYAMASEGQRVYDYDLNENGTSVPYGTTEADFKGDVLTGKAVDFLERRAPESQPFFLSVGYTAPHGGGPDPSPQPPADCADTAKPAPRHATAFDAEPLPLPDNFNEADVTDKPTGVANLATLDQAAIDNATRRYRCRIEAIQHIDEGVGQMLDTLRDAGELDDTLVIYTADNGFFHGEHRIQSGKNRAYEEAIRVPLMMRGPGVPEGIVARELAVNADLAPTILDAADATADDVVDGRSLLRAVRNPRELRGREILLEKGDIAGEGEPEDPASFTGIRNRSYKYIEYGTGELELYDLRTDPFELENLVDDPAFDAVEAALAARLALLAECAGDTCRTVPGLDLHLEYRSGPGDCARGAVTAAVTGADAGSLTQAAFEIDGSDAGTRSEPPFEVRIPGSRVSRRPPSAVAATARLLDGRVMSLDERVRAC